MLSYTDILQEAAKAGYQADPFEKALRLLELLDSLRSHPFLKDRLVLKGGTALNLFVFDIPRLSVDLDLNYLGASPDRDTMLRDRPQIDQALSAVSSRLGIAVRHLPAEHAGGKWRLSYVATSGRSQTLELDLNFLLRTPLWPPVLSDSRPLASITARGVRLLDIHELAAGKLAALFARKTARDFFDTRLLLREANLNPQRLRLGFLVYGSFSRKDWRTIRLEDLRLESKDAETQLLPMLRGDWLPAKREIPSWCQRLVSDCRDLVSPLLPLKPPETEFLTRLNDHGEVAPELLTSEPPLQALLRSHPALLWKAKNVRHYKKRQP